MDIEKYLQYYRKIRQEIISHERSFDKDTLARVEKTIEVLEWQLNLTDTVNEIAKDLESSADACNEHGDLILVEQAVSIIKEYLLPEEVNNE